MANRKREATLKLGITNPCRALLLLCLAFVFALTAAANQRVRLIPKLTSGESFRYEIETAATTSNKVTSPIIDPGGAIQASESISLLVRLDVLHADLANKNGLPGAVRLRATYEKSHATSKDDANDPTAPSPDDSYKRLEGHSIEFTIEPGGAISDFSGIEGIFSNRAEMDPILSWARGLSLTEGAPGKGIVIGQKWNTERPFAGAPLSDLIVHSESTYLRNEPCESAANATVTKSPLPQDDCAVILTSYKILRHGSSRSDATPPDFARNGLRTSGTWVGSGENIESISLSTGLIVRSTQSSTQDVDYEITSLSSGSSIHQVSHSTTHSEIKLVPAVQSAAKP